MQAYDVSIATLTKEGNLELRPWRTRPPSEHRRAVMPMSAAIFAFRLLDQRQDPIHADADKTPTCICCNIDDLLKMSSPDSEIPVEALYEETDWVEIDKKESLSKEIKDLLQKNILSLRQASDRMTLSRIAAENPPK